MKTQSIPITIFALLLVFLASCKKDDTPTSPGGGGGGATTTSFSGTFASGSESGSVQLTIQGLTNTTATATVVVTGTMKPVGAAAIAMSGTYNQGTHILAASGGAAGNVHTIAGSVSGNTLSGSFTSPLGTGSVTMSTSASSTVKVYVGTYTSSVMGNPSGYFNLVRDNTTLSGLAVSTTSATTDLNGIVVGDSIKVYLPGSSTLFLALGHFTNAADTAAVGVYDDQSSDNGTWQCRLSQ